MDISGSTGPSGLVSIITACSRPQNLSKLFESMNFDLIKKWYIIYDTSKGRTYTHAYEDNSKILEIDHNEHGMCGHPQINFALKLVTEGYVYVLDDDNIMHPDFWRVLPTMDQEFIYTWNQLRRVKPPRVMLGNDVRPNKIDTAQFIVPRKYIGDIEWMPNKRGGDGKFISDVKAKWPDSFKFIGRNLCYFNYLRPI